MKKQMFILAIATVFACASLTAKADVFDFTYIGNGDGVFATGTLTGNLSTSTPGEYLITSGDIDVTGIRGASAAMNGLGTLSLFPGDSPLFPYSDPLMSSSSNPFMFAMQDGMRVTLDAAIPGTYGMYGGWYGFSDTGTLSASATPEPSSLLLLGTGVMGLAGLVRRKLAATA